MDPVEKNMLIGAFTTGLVDLALEGYYAYNDGLGKNLRGQFPYISIHEAIPPVDDWIACAGVPLALYALGKSMKNPKLVTMAKGGAVYGASELIGQTTFRLALQTQPAAARYVVLRR